MSGSALEYDSQAFQAGEFVFYVGHFKGGHGNSLRKHGFLKRFARGIGIGFERELDVVRSFGRSDGEPAKFAHGNLVLLFEAENFGIKLQRFGLIVHHDAGQLDSHGKPSGKKTNEGTVNESGGMRFLKIADLIRETAKGVGRQVGHQGETGREELFGEYAGHDDEGTRFSAVLRRRDAHSLLKESTEAAEAGHAYFHADFRDAEIALGKQEFCQFDAFAHAKLMRRDAKEGFKLTYEMVRSLTDEQCSGAAWERLQAPIEGDAPYKAFQMNWGPLAS